jgi:energy-coupling factor transporter ATP-binding protein EcfA2
MPTAPLHCDRHPPRCLPHTENVPEPNTPFDRLASRDLTVVTGKGGVGKSTLAATLARLLVSRGKRVLLLEVDPRETLHQLLGVAPSGGEAVTVEPGLLLQNVQPRGVLDRLVREHLRIELLVNRVLASPVYRHFAEGAPGLKEVAVLGHALRTLRKEGSETAEIDRVVLDAPATGHGVSMLAAPGLVAEVIRDGPLGRMGKELAEFVADPLRCAVVVATLAEEMPVQEALELSDDLDRRLGRRPELLVVNALYPELDAAAAAAAAAAADDDDDDDDALRTWRRRRRLNDRQLERIRSRWQGFRVELPMLPLERGPELVNALADPLERGLLDGGTSP